MLTKPNHISQLLSPPFAKMVEPTDQSFSTVFFPYLRDSTWTIWNPHPNPVSSPPPITNPDSTTINTTNSHTKNPKECTETHNQIPHHWRRRRRRRRRTQSKKKKKKNRSQKMELRPKTMKRRRLLLQLLWQQTQSTSWCRWRSFQSQGHVSHDPTWA